MPQFPTKAFFDGADDQAAKEQPAMPSLRYVIRPSWLEAFEAPITPSCPTLPWLHSARARREDAVTRIRASFGVFEIFFEDGSSVRVADTSTRWAHISNKVRLAQYVANSNPSICPPSGWLPWDCEFDGSTKDPLVNPTPGSEFLQDISQVSPWVLKRDGMSQGWGIIFVSSVQEVKAAIEHAWGHDDALPFVSERDIAGWAAQKHISPMLVLGGRKFSLRAYIVSVGSRTFRYVDQYDVRVAPEPWTADFKALGCHLSNLGAIGYDESTKSERIFLARDVPELSDVVERIPAFLQRVFAHPAENNNTRGVDAIPACVMGLDIMADATGELFLLECNHSPGAPPNEGKGEVAEHTRLLCKRIVALLISCAMQPELSREYILESMGFFEIM